MIFIVRFSTFFVFSFIFVFSNHRECNHFESYMHLFHSFLFVFLLFIFSTYIFFVALVSRKFATTFRLSMYLFLLRGSFSFVFHFYTPTTSVASYVEYSNFLFCDHCNHVIICFAHVFLLCYVFS